MSVDPYMEIGAQSQLKLLTKDHLQAMSGSGGRQPGTLSNRGSACDLQETSQKLNKSSISNSLAVPGTAQGVSGGPNNSEFPPRLSIRNVECLLITLDKKITHFLQDSCKISVGSMKFARF